MGYYKTIPIQSDLAENSVLVSDVNILPDTELELLQNLSKEIRDERGDFSCYSMPAPLLVKRRDNSICSIIKDCIPHVPAAALSGVTSRFHKQTLQIQTCGCVCDHLFFIHVLTSHRYFPLPIFTYTPVS